MPSVADRPWSMPLTDLFSKLDSSTDGLADSEVGRRRQQFGLNTFDVERRFVRLTALASKFTSPLILILIFAAALAAVVGEVLDFILIVLIIIASGVIDFFQEWQSSQAAKKLKEKVSVSATVFRDRKEKEIPTVEIVPGDIVFLAAGDLVPVDARLFFAKDFFVDESNLTGESLPTEKKIGRSVSPNSSLNEVSNCVFRGTHVVSGEARAVVFSIGRETEFGQITHSLSSKRPATAFEKGIKDFGFLVMKLTLILTLFVFFSNYYIRQDILNSFLFALALAVGIIPELLPMIVTINLSQGAVFMSRKGVIVKHLPAIQNFGGMNILCTDKTGTLTEGKIELELYENCDGREDNFILLNAFLNSFFQSGYHNPLDEAVVRHHEVRIDKFRKIDEIPFDFRRRRLSVVVEYQNERILIVKGAPESIFPVSQFCLEKNVERALTQEKTSQLRRRYAELSQDGFRVLAIAARKLQPYDRREIYFPSDEISLTLLGFIAFLDPPKVTAKVSLQRLERQGIALKVLTGDNEFVTRKVCQELDLPVTGIVTASQLDQTRDEDLTALTHSANIFTRLSPEQKTRIITALRRSGAVVGYLGDGINDAPSLRAADIGISVNNGTDVAKDSADIILLSKSLKVLAEGVSEGRKTFANVLKYILMATSSNFGNMFSVALASVFLPFLPMLPVQILLNNFLYDLSQITIHTDNVDHEDLQRPREWDISFIKKFMIVFGPISSLFDFLTFGVLLWVFKASQPVFQAGWFIESLATQILIIFSIRTRRRPFFKSRPSLPLTLTVLTVLFSGLAVTLSPLKTLFAFGELNGKFFFVLGGLVVAYFVLVESVKGRFLRPDHEDAKGG